MSDATVTCFDTLTPNALPAGVEFFVDYYGETAVRAQILARFPGAFGISFTFSPSDAGALDCWVCDCEQRGWLPPQAAYWAHQRVLMGKRPCIFVEVSMKPAVEQALAVYGLEFGRDVDCWLSWWGRPAVIPQGIVQTPLGPVATGVGNIGIQYLNNGDAYDESVLDLAWVQTLMPPPPAPVPKEGETMLIAVPKALVKNCQDDWVLNGAAYFNLWDEAAQDGQVTTYAKGFTGKDADKLVKAGFPVADDSDGGLLNRAAGHVVTAA